MRATRFTLALVVLVGLTFGGVGVAAADDDRHERPKDHREKSKDHRFDEKDRKGDDRDRKKAEKRDRKRRKADHDRKRRKARKSARERTKRVVVCHVSKKDAETLEVSKRTAKKHLKYHKHDYLGPCDAKDRFDRKSHH